MPLFTPDALLKNTIGSVNALADFMRPVTYATDVTIAQTDDISTFIASPGTALWDSPQIGYPAGVRA